VISYDSSGWDLETKLEEALLELLRSHGRNTEGLGESFFRWDHAHDVDEINPPYVVVKAIKQTCESNPNGDLWDVGVDITLYGGGPIHARIIENALGKAYDLPAKLSGTVFGVESCHFTTANQKEFDERGISMRVFSVVARCAHTEPANA